MLAISTSCFGTRFSHLREAAEATRLLGLDHIEIGLPQTPLRLDDAEAALRDFGVRAPVLRAGCREIPRGNDRTVDHIAATDDAARKKALEAIGADIEIAKRSGSGTLSLRGGFVAVPGIAERIRTLTSHIRMGKEKETLELREEIRLALAPRRLAHLDRLCRSLHAIAKSTPGLRLAIETAPDPRYLPTPEEMEHVLSDLSGLPISYMHDTAAAASWQKLDGMAHGQWLEKLASHLCGMRLQDALATQTGLPPGLGEIDWQLVADYAPRAALGILDLAPEHGEEGLRGAMRFLAKFGWQS